MWTLDLIRELADETGEMLASIYFPTFQTGPEIQQNAIRMKNAVQALEQEREARGLDNALFAELIQHPQALIEDQTFWQHQSLGLALFCRPSGMRIIKLPFAPIELSRLGQRFHIAPLIRGSGDNPVFHLLAVNREGSILYDISGDQVAERPIDPMLDSLSAARGMSDYDAAAGFHTDHRGGVRSDSADGTPRYHALGTGTDEQEEIELERYLSSIASAVGEALAASEAPLVLAGGDRIVGRIRGMIKARRLCEGFVAHNTAAATADELASKARDIIKEERNCPVSEALEQLEARLNAGEQTASTDSGEVMKAAREGRIDVAFLDLQDSTLGAEIDTERAKMLDSIAIETIRHGGTVYAMPSTAASRMAPAAALYRW